MRDLLDHRESILGDHRLAENQNGILDELESGINRLKIDFDRFFNGALPLPPEEQRERVKRMIREARSRRLPTFAHRFHLNTLEARFNTLSELFNRRLRDLEHVGTVPRARTEGRPTFPRGGLVLGASPDLSAVSSLYNELYKTAGRQAKTDFDSFHKYLRQQISALRKRTGCEKVRFRVSSTKGQPTLKAKPLKPAGAD